MSCSRLRYEFLIPVAVYLLSAASVLRAEPAARPLSPCDVLAYVSIGPEGEHHLLHATREQGISFDPNGAFLADLRKVSTSEFPGHFMEAKRSAGPPEFPCDKRQYQLVMEASSLTRERHLSGGPLDAAEKKWRETINSQPRNPLLHIALGNILALEKKWKEMANEAETAVHLAAGTAEAHSLLGESWLMRAYQEKQGPRGGPNQDLLQQAVAELTTAVTLAPRNCFLRSNLAIALISKRDFKSADKESDIAEKQCPHSMYTIWVGANSLAEQGNMNAAIAKLRAGLKEAPSCVMIREYLRELLTSQGDTRAAKLVEEEGKTVPPPTGTACPTMPAK